MKVSMCLCLVGLLLPLISGLPVEDSNLPAPDRISSEEQTLIAEENANIPEHPVNSNQTDDSVLLTNATIANDGSVVNHSNSTVENVELNEGESGEGILDETTLDLTTEEAKIEEQSEEYNMSSTEVSRDTEVEEITKEKSVEQEDDDDDDDKAVEDMDDNDDEDNIASLGEVEATGKPVVNETSGAADYELNAADGSKEDEEDTTVPEESSKTNVNEKSVGTNEIEDQSKVDEEVAQVVKELSADDAKHAEHEARFTKYDIYFKKTAVRFAAIQFELDSVKAQLDSHISASAMFSAYVEKDAELQPGATIPYNRVIENIGDRFDADTHSFSAPVDGAYYFSHTTYTSDESECEDRMHKNGNELETEGHAGVESSVVLQLVAGDVITVHPQQNCTVHGGGTVFNGFLIA